MDDNICEEVGHSLALSLEMRARLVTCLFLSRIASLCLGNLTVPLVLETEFNDRRIFVETNKYRGTIR